MITPILVVGGALGFTLVLARLGRGRVTLTDGEGVRFSGFNALRALAALGVVAGHSLTTSSLDWLPRAAVENMATGVALFFVISGFLLYRPFATSLTERGKVSIRRFIANRALRILPLYILVVVVVFFATTGHPFQSLMRLARALSFTGVYTRDDFLPVAWSLDDEMAFYLLLPALYLALMAWPRQHQRLWLGAGAIAALSLVSLVALAVSPQDQAITGGPVTKFHLFGLGMLLATLHARWPRFQLSPKLLLGGAAGVATALLISGIAYEKHLYAFDPVCGVAFFLLVGMVAFSGPTARLTRTLSWRPLSHLGDVSYGIYLWHEPLHHVLYNSGLLSHAYFPGFLELAMCSIALATGTYFLVEKPALRIKNRWAVSTRAGQSTGPPKPVASPASAPAT
jgi:peptidoglycan/LPS O-acetylase OafA/YrhL